MADQSPNEKPLALPRKIWLKRVWIPLWVCELLATIFYIIWASLFDVIEFQSPWDGEGYPYPVELNSPIAYLNPAAIVGLTFAGLTLVFTITQIVLFAMKKLTPRTAVGLTATVLVMWLAAFLYSIIWLVIALPGEYTGLLWIIACFMWPMTAGNMIYSAVILSHQRRGYLDVPASNLTDVGNGAGLSRPQSEGPVSSYRFA